MERGLVSREDAMEIRRQMDWRLFEAGIQDYDRDEILQGNILVTKHKGKPIGRRVDFEFTIRRPNES